MGLSLLFVALGLATRAQAIMPWQDWTLPIDERVNDLVGRLTLSEKINQTWSIAPAITRFNITAYNWRSNCMHDEYYCRAACT
jgi:beta-glucosidase